MGIAQKHVSEAVTATLVHAEKPREIANPFSHMKNRYFITFAFALLATSVFCTACRQTKQAEGLIPIPDKTAYSSSISALLDEYRFIPLSTTDENLLGRIAKIIKYNNKFYIASDRKRILVFNADGSFSHRIDRLGRGPQEYTELADFDISNDRIFLLGFRKVFVYSLEGMFIKRIDLPYNTLKLQTIGNDLLIRSNKESLFYRIDIASGESKDLRIGMKQSTRIDEDNCFKPYPDGYLMQEGFSTTFYHIASDFSIEELNLFSDDRFFDEQTENEYIREHGSSYDEHTTKEYIGSCAGWQNQHLYQIQRNPSYEKVEYLVADLAARRIDHKISPACDDDVSYMGLSDLFKYAHKGSSPDGFLTYLRPAELREAICRHGDDGTQHYRWMREHILDRIRDDDNPVLVEFRFKPTAG